MKTQHKPGDLLKMFREGGMKRKAAMKAAGIKHSGTFHGKSNALGHGGRAAQLKAQGVPGGVIGALARRAHAAPGQANYHGKKKVAAPEKQNLGLALKKSHKMKESVVHHHIHVHGHKGALHVHMKGSKVSDPTAQGTGLEHSEENKHEFKHSKKMKHMKRKSASHGSKMEDPTGDGENLEHEEEGKKEFKKSHKCKGSACKHSSHKKKSSKRKASLEGGYANTPAGAGAKARQAINQTVQHVNAPSNSYNAPRMPSPSFGMQSTTPMRTKGSKTKKKARRA